MSQTKALTTNLQQYPLKPLSDIDPLKLTIPERVCIYVAGYFDGEGCLGIYCTSKKYGYIRAIAKVSASDRVVLNLLESYFGGSVRAHSGNKTKQPQEKDEWEWILAGKGRLYIFLHSVLPYLLIKRSQAELMVRFVESMHEPGRHSYSEEEKLQRLEITRRLKLLKREPVHE